MPKFLSFTALVVLLVTIPSSNCKKPKPMPTTTSPPETSTGWEGTTDDADTTTYDSYNSYSSYDYPSYVDFGDFSTSDSAANAFENLDRNHDSSITLVEFLLTIPEVKQALVSFAKFDGDNSDVIEKSERDQFVKNLKDAERQRKVDALNSTLKAYDKGDSKLQASEFVKYLQSQLSMCCKNGKTIDQVMALYDEDHDKAISPQELFNFKRNMTVAEDFLQYCWTDPYDAYGSHTTDKYDYDVYSAMKG
uniref:EF-hand domain-containing protein n=1 Tax=Plectus sambesii TaxID=2011161 RepID=A0A914VB23_9BILA